MSRDTGGDAFPSHGSMGERVETGMTLRDYFAAKVMHALIAKCASAQDWLDLASTSYVISDQMLKERAK